MSSNYDYILIETGIEFPEFELMETPAHHEWQTKSFPDSCMRLHRVTADGKLYRAEHQYHESGFPEGAQGGYELLDDLHRNNNPIDEGTQNTFEWQRIRYTGTLRIVGGSSTSEFHHYDLSFDVHELDSITRVYPHEPTADT